MKTSQKIQPNARHSGFTILEVMIAISILAIGLLAVFSGQNMAIQGNNRASYLTEGMTLAQDKMEELLASPYASVTTGTGTQGTYSIAWTVTEYSADNYKLIAVEVNGQGLRKKLQLNCIKTLL